MGIIGSFEGYVSSPLYFYNNGTWSNLQTPGASGSSQGVYDGRTALYNGGTFIQTVSLTNYDYLKMCWNANVGYERVVFSFSIRKTPDGENIASYEFNAYTSRGWKYGILDISGISGYYYIFFSSGYYRSGTSKYGCDTYINQIFLSTL